MESGKKLSKVEEVIEMEKNQLVLGDILEILDTIIWTRAEFLTKEQKQKLISLFKFDTEGDTLRDYILNDLELPNDEEENTLQQSIEELKQQVKQGAEDRLYGSFWQCVDITHNWEECLGEFNEMMNGFTKDIIRGIKDEEKYRKEENKKDRR